MGRFVLYTLYWRVSGSIMSAGARWDVWDTDEGVLGMYTIEFGICLEKNNSRWRS